MRLSVRVGAVEFSGLTDKGFLIGPDGFKGWDDSTPTKRQAVDRPWAHGAFSIRGFRDVRVVTLSGSCLADSEQQLNWYDSQLTGLLADGDIGRIVVEHSGVTTWADCYVDDQPQFVMTAAGALATFQIKFWCPDPRKFGDAHVVAGGVSAPNYGNFAATPVHVVSGDMSGYTINGPDGKQFIVTVPVVSGHPHTIDMSKSVGLLSIDGVYVMGGLGSRTDVWAIPAGGQIAQTLTPTSGSGTLATTVVDTYV